LLLQHGDVAPTTQSDVLGPVAIVLAAQHASPTGDSMPYTSATDSILDELAQLKPRMLATHHGSTCLGDGAQVLRDLAHVLRDVHHHSSRSATV
jgi:hypothetical protein